MRVLFISKPYVSKPYRQKLRYLAKNPDFEVGLICPTAWGNQQFEEPDSSESEEIWIRAVPIGFQDRNHFHFYKQLEKHVTEFGPDLINVEEEDYSFVTWQVFRIARRLGLKAMFYAWQNIEKKYPPPFSWFQQSIYSFAAGAMGGSKTAEQICRKNGYRGEFAVLPQIGIDFDLFELKTVKSVYKEQLGISDDTFVVYYAGRIVEEKGVQDVLKALATWNNSKVLFLCIGTGPFSEALERQASELDLGSKVQFIPYVDTSNIAIYSKAADALCLGSRTLPNWKEQGPVRVVTESMAAGAIAVVSDSGELPDVVGDKGLIFAEGDSDGLLAHLQFLHGSPEKTQEMARAARDYCRDSFSAQAVAKRCGEFLKKVGCADRV